MFKTMLILSALPLLLTFLINGSNKNVGGSVGEQNRKTKTLQKGTWGGEHIQLEVSEEGGQIEYDCAHGSIDQKIALDARGRFKVAGTHVVERGGPVRESGSSNGDPVEITGRVSGKKLELTVRRRVSKEVIGAFTLFYGHEGKLRKCR